MSDRKETHILDCWNHIGVRGDRSCEWLAVQSHCRNCDVYTHGARAIMQRPLPEGYRIEWAEYFARPETMQKNRDRSALVFRIANEWLALPASVAVNVAETAQPHRLPRRSGGALIGIVGVKGKMYPCMSLAHLMSIQEDQPRQPPGKRVYPRLLVVELAQQMFALPVDDMYGIFRHAESDLQAAPTTVNKTVYRYLTGVLSLDAMRIGCLDTELVGYQLASALR